MLTFSVTLYGDSEHAERNAAQELFHALDTTHNEIEVKGPLAMLIGEAKYEPALPTKEDRDRYDKRVAGLQAH